MHIIYIYIISLHLPVKRLYFSVSALNRNVCVHMTTTACVKGPVGRVVEVLDYVKQYQSKECCFFIILFYMYLCPVYVYLMSYCCASVWMLGITTEEGHKMAK